MSSDRDLGNLKPLDLPSGKDYTHRVHRFPGKFHPPLISKILDENPEHEHVADPMCGSGTVAVESIVSSKDALCVDLDPLSCLMTRAKTTPVDPQDMNNVAKRILDLAGQMPENGSVDPEEAKARVESNLQNTPYFPPLNLLHWFEPHVALGFSRLLQSADMVLRIETNEMRDAIHTVLASIVRKISRADPQPVSGLEVTKVRKEELDNGLEFDITKQFNRSLNRLKSGYEQLLSVGQIGRSIVIEADAKDFSNVARRNGYQPSLIVTSPPYCNAIEYTRRHRLEYEWLGLFPGDSYEELREDRLERSRDFFGSPRVLKDTRENLPKVPHLGVREITDRIHNDEGEEKKANLLRKYFLDAYDWLYEIYSTMPEDGLFYMTIGPSTAYGHRIDTPQYLSEIAREIGFLEDNVYQYKLTNNKMQYPTKGPTTETESLIRFKK